MALAFLLCAAALVAVFALNFFIFTFGLGIGFYLGVMASPAWLRFVLGLMFLAAVNAGSAWALLVVTRRRAALQWAVWWVLAIDAALRLGSSVTRFLDMPDSWGYGVWFSAWYDFKAAPWSFGVAVAAGAASTLGVVGWFLVGQKFGRPGARTDVERSAVHLTSASSRRPEGSIES